jgi:Xaa-Pro dipeptidase
MHGHDTHGEGDSMRDSRAKKVMGRAEGVDSLVIMNGQDPYLDPTYRYLTDNQSGLMEGCLLTVFPDGSMDSVVSRMEEGSARLGGGRVHVYQSQKEREDLILDLLQDSRRIGINSGSLTVRSANYLQSLLPQAELVDVSEAISATRSIKDEREIGRIRRACQISSSVAEEMPSFLQDGVTEREVKAMVEMRLQEKGGHGNAFATIVAFGENSAEPHHYPSDRALRKGDVVLTDFGCRYEGYCSDLTRTVFFGKPDRHLAKAYATVLKAKRSATASIRAGVGAMDVDGIARGIIDESEFQGLFTHSFGHEIGMNVHEGGSLGQRSSLVLKEGMVVSAEPGIYIDGHGGIRVEDTILVLEDGFEPLTDFDQNLTVV